MSELSFDLTLYDAAALHQAIDDYSQLAQIEIVETACKAVCRFHMCRYAQDITMHEFANYALELTVKREA